MIHKILYNNILVYTSVLNFLENNLHFAVIYIQKIISFYIYIL